jgi:hypothetical protein
MRLRRDHDRFIDLMASVCFLRQYQKPVKSELVNGKQIEYIECDETDYTVAREFMVNGMLASTLDELPKSVKRFYGELRSMIKEKAEESGIKPVEADIQQREIRKRIDWLSIDRVKRYLRYLVRYEFIIIRTGGSRGQRYSYSLAYDEPIEEIDISMIPDIEEIRKRMKTRKNIKWGKVGQNSDEALKA